MSKRGERLGRRIRKATYFFLGLALCGLSIVIATQAAELDYFGPPPDNDVFQPNRALHRDDLCRQCPRRMYR